MIRVGFMAGYLARHHSSLLRLYPRWPNTWAWLLARAVERST